MRREAWRPTAYERAASLALDSVALRSRELTAHRYERRVLPDLARAGRLVRIARGIYRNPEAPDDVWSDCVVARKRVPHATVCGLTALHIHGFVAERPAELWLAIDRKARLPVVGDAPWRFLRASGAQAARGVVCFRVSDTDVWVTDRARSVVEAFKYRRHVPAGTAMSALRACTGEVSDRELLEIAAAMRVRALVQSALRQR